MTRRFWAGLMLVAVVLALGSAYVLLEKLMEPAPQPVPLKRVAPPKPVAPPVVVSTAAANVAVSSEPAKPAVEEKAPEKAAPISTGKRNVLFRLNKTAKEISIIGDFNDWTRQKMKKDAKGFSISISLKPGRYEYAFVVDGKRMRDPNNKQTASNGRSSVLTVKPLAKP